MENRSKIDWHDIARIVLISRKIDDLEEQVLAPSGIVTYQFSAGGHELGQALVSQTLGRPRDAVAAYYRSRPLMLGLGLTIDEALASDMARRGSINGGRDVGVVFNLPNRGKATVIPMAADVGSQYTPGAGWAQAIRYYREVLGETDLDESMVFIIGGDGSVASNGFWSSLTQATTLQLPLLYIIEDNGYAISVRRDLQTPGGNIAANLASFNGLTVWSGSGTEPTETATLILDAVEHVRSGRGPGLLHLTVPRLSGHSSVDNQAYKSDEIKEKERLDDPVVRLRDYLVPELMEQAAWDQLVEDVNTEVLAARDRALAQEKPDPETVGRFVFSSPEIPQKVGGLLAEGVRLPAGDPIPRPENRRINMIEAIRRTLDLELSLNPRCLVFGEDVGVKGGVHTATMGLMAKYGDRRVFDTSLSEEGIIGRAVGLALAGLMPVPEIQYRKYADPATEQLNNCGTIRWRSANQFAAPMVVRIPGGFGRKVGDPWHSVSGEANFAHTVGWYLAYPSNAKDAVGLLRTALRGNDPVIFFEHRALLDAGWSRRPYPGDAYMLPFGQANKIREGSDLTVVTWGAMVERCENAVEQLGADVDLLDLRTIAPWDEAAVLASVAKTSKCLIVHEDIGVAGFGAEIAAVIAEKAFLDLDGPITRLTTPSVPIPFDVGLMDAVIPSVEAIGKAIIDLIAF